jgi:hypothetical protein
VPVTGSNKIDTVAAELVPRNRRAASVLNSRRRILREFRNATLGGVRRGCLRLLEWTQARRVRGTANVDRPAAVRVQFSLSAGISRRCVLDCWP